MLCGGWPTLPIADLFPVVTFSLSPKNGPLYGGPFFFLQKKRPQFWALFLPISMIKLILALFLFAGRPSLADAFF